MLVVGNKWRGGDQRFIGDQSADKTNLYDNYTTLADTIFSNSICRLMNTPARGTECVMLGNAGHTDAADSRTFGFPKSQTFWQILSRFKHELKTPPSPISNPDSLT